MPHKLSIFTLLLALSLTTACAAPVPGRERIGNMVVLEAAERMEPPAWATKQRELFRENMRGLRLFEEKYYDRRGYLKVKTTLGGGTGADDATEHTWNWSLFYALGGADDARRIMRKAWEGHYEQYTKAGALKDDFIKSFDWQHNGEQYCSFFHRAFGEPYNQTYVEHACRFADFYLGKPNYDPEHNIIRSVLNGSAGPNLDATVEDWGGSDFFTHWVGKNVRGDTPFNLMSTSLVLTAFGLRRQPKYHDWIVKYIDGWVERARNNNWNFPGNVGLNGEVGEDWPDPAEQFPGYVPEGSDIYPWAGGIMGWSGWGGWGFVPASVRMGMKNAYILTGDPKYLEAMARQMENLREGIKIGERKNGRPVKVTGGWQRSWMAMDLYLITMDPRYTWYMEDWQPGRWQPGEGVYDMGWTRDWIAYLQGRYQEFPEKMLDRSVARTRSRIEKIKADESKDWERKAELRHSNPITTSALTMLTTGAREPSWRGSPWVSRLRYFDPEKNRAGLPADVGALVDKMDEKSVWVTLVNLSEKEPRTVVIQGGAYAEHSLVAVQVAGKKERKLDKDALAIVLRPGCGRRLRIEMDRFTRPPSFDFPWRREK